LLQSLELARAFHDPSSIRDVSGPLSEHYRNKGDWKAALEMNELHTLMRDSVRNEEVRRSSIRQQYQYEFEKKETEMAATQAQQDVLARERLQVEKNRRNVFLFLGTGILILAAGLWNRLRYTRRSREAIEKEKDVSDGLLHNILPVEVAAELKVKGHAEARHFDRATILFTDFKGFTELSEMVTPAELVEELNHCFKFFDGLMERYRIEKIKTIGDAYMAAGGVPDPQHGAPADVVNAALDMQEFMATHKVRRQTEGKPYFEMRVGIHTGPVIAGIVGTKKFQYDIWGDTVNTASRMESSGEVGRVNISEATYVLVKNVKKANGEGGASYSPTPVQHSPEPMFVFTPRGKVHAKGKGEMEMYFVGRSS
ncbi:MAG TPA: adenylate/guanylate cyclase domain-containing protein, partial [Flavobacteriales bacterium]|nr:adenylate/guanylate cyclase domain-containing protein [Flavobacteriales bacterium]